jgi:site-specific DNA-methyltransferase (cytosine-N4-specific)
MKSPVVGEGTQQPLQFHDPNRIRPDVGLAPFYTTPFGEAYVGDSAGIMTKLPENSVNLILTSPPYALHFKKKYGNVSKQNYLEWFLAFAKQIHRILTPDGSFVLNIGGSWNPGSPTRSLYQYKLLIELVDQLGFHLAQEFYWYNPAKMPVPAEWVTVRRVRVKDAVEHVWWLSKSTHPKASNLKVLKPYSADMIRLNQRGVRETVRPSGHVINKSWDKMKTVGAIPGNVFEENAPDDMLKFGNNAANDPYTLACKEKGLTIHPARYPSALPEFFIKMLTDEYDLVVDPFAGSNTTGATAERLMRYWIAIDQVEEYLEGSKFRFESLSGNPRARETP